MSDANDTVELPWQLEDDAIFFDLNEELYSRDAIFGAAYLFIDRCYAFLARPSDATVRVRLRVKKAPATEELLIALAGEFANELLNQVVRAQVGESTRTIREYYMARAFFSQPQQTSIDALLAELDAEELEDDPLEIAVPWGAEAGAGAEAASGAGDVAEGEAPAADDAPAADAADAAEAPADG